MSDIRIMRSPQLNARLSAAEAQLSTLEQIATSSVADAIAAPAGVGSSEFDCAMMFLSDYARCAAQYAADTETNAMEVRRRATDASRAIERSVSLLQRLIDLHKVSTSLDPNTTKSQGHPVTAQREVNRVNLGPSDTQLPPSQ